MSVQSEDQRSDAGLVQVSVSVPAFSDRSGPVQLRIHAREGGGLGAWALQHADDLWLNGTLNGTTLTMALPPDLASRLEVGHPYLAEVRLGDAPDDAAPVRGIFKWPDAPTAPGSDARGGQTLGWRARLLLFLVGGMLVYGLFQLLQTLIGRPHALTISLSVPAGEPKVIDVDPHVRRPGGQPLQSVDFCKPKLGRAAPIDQSRFKYQAPAQVPPEAEDPIDRFCYRATTTDGMVAEGTVEVTIEGPKNPPIMVAGRDYSTRTRVGTPLDIPRDRFIVGADADTLGRLSLRLLTQEGPGSFAPTGSTGLRYQPPADPAPGNQVRTARAEYEIAGPDGGKTRAIITVEVAPALNCAPLTGAVESGAAIPLDLGPQVTPGGEKPRARASTPPTQGQVRELGDLRLSYQARAGATGRDAFAYTLTAADGAKAECRVAIDIRPATDGPIKCPRREIGDAMGKGDRNQAQQLCRQHCWDDGEAASWCGDRFFADGGEAAVKLARDYYKRAKDLGYPSAQEKLQRVLDHLKNNGGLSRFCRQHCWDDGEAASWCGDSFFADGAGDAVKLARDYYKRAKDLGYPSAPEKLQRVLEHLQNIDRLSK